MEAESKGGSVVKLIGFVDSSVAPIKLHDFANAQCGQGHAQSSCMNTDMVWSTYRLSFTDSRRMTVCRQTLGRSSDL